MRSNGRLGCAKCWKWICCCFYFVFKGFYLHVELHTEWVIHNDLGHSRSWGQMGSWGVQKRWECTYFCFIIIVFTCTESFLTSTVTSCISIFNFGYHHDLTSSILFGNSQQNSLWIFRSNSLNIKSCSWQSVFRYQRTSLCTVLVFQVFKRQTSVVKK